MTDLDRLEALRATLEADNELSAARCVANAIAEIKTARARIDGPERNGDDPPSSDHDFMHRMMGGGQ